MGIYIFINIYLEVKETFQICLLFSGVVTHRKVVWGTKARGHWKKYNFKPIATGADEPEAKQMI